MKISVKTLKGTHFSIDVKPEDTVANVKQAIETAQGDVYPAAQQMLIHQGKVLKDDTTLDENKVSDNGFLIIMLSKDEDIPEQAEVVPAAPLSAGPNANPLDLFPQGRPTVAGAASSLDFIISLSQGLPAVAGNVDRTLDFLRNSLQFPRLAARVQEDPDILQPMLQELEEQNPFVKRLIQEHLADFLSLITEPVKEEVPERGTMTQNDWETIQRLEAMGFDRLIAYEVFFACNMNVESAYYLLNHIFKPPT